MLRRRYTGRVPNCIPESRVIAIRFCLGRRWVRNQSLRVFIERSKQKGKLTVWSKGVPVRFRDRRDVSQSHWGVYARRLRGGDLPRHIEMDKRRVPGENGWDHRHDVPRVGRPPGVPLQLCAHRGAGGGCPVVEPDAGAPEGVQVADVEVSGHGSVPETTDRLHMPKGGVGCSEGMSLGHETS
jgi:hypothetical protein